MNVKGRSDHRQATMLAIKMTSKLVGTVFFRLAGAVYIYFYFFTSATLIATPGFSRSYRWDVSILSSYGSS